MIIGPQLLKNSVLRRSTRVFLCGPGIGGNNFEIREFAKKLLSKYPNVDVHYGEHIEQLASFKKRRRDLQTLEVEFAHTADFTILILESPGSIAELGTFSMIPNLRGRLVVLVPSRFYDDNSYISRGPLSLISRSFLSNVIYYENENSDILKKKILYPLTFYKFAHERLSYQYQTHLNYAYKSRNYNEDSYEKFISEVRQEFNATITFVAMLILGRPTFPELVASAALSPSDTSSALRMLHKASKVIKLPNGRYRALNGYSDALLTNFNTTEISRAKALRNATLDGTVTR